MELMLEIISRQKFSLQQSDVQHVFREVGGYIGRDKQCEWVLLDKTKQISRKHALISFEQSAFFIEDLSTNGIFNALGKERLGKGKKYRVEHGNTYVIGEYSIQARLLHEPESCLSEQSIESGEIIPAGDFLADDPLLALEQQDELNARERLGLYNDLLGATPEKKTLQADHTEARLGVMPQITLVPEDWNEEEGEEEETLLEGFEEVGVELGLFWQPASVATVSSETTDRKRRFLFFIITPFSWNLMTKI